MIWNGMSDIHFIHDYKTKSFTDQMILGMMMCAIVGWVERGLTL